jgi:protein O-mannosyl-transferase
MGKSKSRKARKQKAHKGRQKKGTETQSPVTNETRTEGSRLASEDARAAREKNTDPEATQKPSDSRSNLTRTAIMAARNLVARIETTPSDSPPPPFTWLTAGTALLLVVAVIVAYQPAFNNGFIWDDPEYVINNPTLRDFDGLKSIWAEPGATPQYYPLVFTTFWIEYSLYGLKPFGYHLVNILAHAGGVVLLWFLLRRLRVPGALLAAAVFAVHPVHVESVAWITERKNVLSGLFYLAAFLAYMRFALPEKGSAGETAPGDRPWKYYALAAVLFLCALLCKTVTCTFPAAVLLVLWWKKGRLRRRDMTPTLPLFVVGISFGILTAGLEKVHVGALGDEWTLTLFEKILLAGRIPWFYAGKLFSPNGLVFIYPRWDINTGVWWQYLFPLALAAIVVFFWLVRKKLGRGPLAATLFFVGTLVPALGFFNVYPMRFSFVADHFQYLASLGVIVLAAGTTAAIIGSLGKRQRDTAYLVCCAVLAVLASFTWQQSKVYKDQETLWRETLTINPDAWIAHNNLGEILTEQSKLTEAVEHCKAALALKADLPEALGNLGNTLYHRKKFDEALTCFDRLLARQPDNVTALKNRGATLEALHRYEEAAASSKKALAIAPGDANAHMNVASALRKSGNHSEATEHYDAVLRTNPDAFTAILNRGLCYRKLDRAGDAVTAFRSALKLNPSSGEAMAALARVLATRKGATKTEGIEAVGLGETICRATAFRRADLLDTLAAAYARAERFDKAVETAEKAHRLARAAEDGDLARLIGRRLDLYRRKQTFSE